MKKLCLFILVFSMLFPLGGCFDHRTKQKVEESSKPKMSVTFGPYTSENFSEFLAALEEANANATTYRNDGQYNSMDYLRNLVEWHGSTLLFPVPLEDSISCTQIRFYANEYAMQPPYNATYAFDFSPSSVASADSSEETGNDSKSDAFESFRLHFSLGESFQEIYAHYAVTYEVTDIIPMSDPFEWQYFLYRKSASDPSNLLLSYKNWVISFSCVPHTTDIHEVTEILRLIELREYTVGKGFEDENTIE